MSTNEEKADRIKLFGKILEAQKAAGPMKKDSKNKMQNYTFVSSENVLNVAPGLFHDVGIVITIGVVSRDTTRMTTKAGGDAILCSIVLRAYITDSETGYTIERDFVGDGYNQTDKAPYVAMTGTEKYVYLKLLQIPTTDDDPENDNGKRGGGASNEKVADKKASPPKDQTSTGSLIGEVVAAENAAYDNLSAKTNARKKHLGQTLFAGAPEDKLIAYLEHMVNKKE